MSAETPIPSLEDAVRDYDAPSDPRQKALRDCFVQEYLADFNQTKAAMRVGFKKEFAIQYGQVFMSEPYVQKRIQSLQMMKTDEAQDAEYNKIRIKQALIREAHYYGPGSSHSGRVTALAQLSKLYGMEAPKKSEATVLHKGGVMQVPAIANLDEWEKVAVNSQEQLVHDARG